MTQDEIIEMARQVGIQDAYSNSPHKGVIAQLEAFAKLVDAKATAREREACASMLEDWDKHAWNPFDCAQAIRARGQA